MPQDSRSGPFYQYIQREGERPEEYRYSAFLSTRDGDEVEGLAREYPKRWHMEEFYNGHQALGWNRAGTCNLNIRYGQMTMALIAQAAIERFRRRGPTGSEVGCQAHGHGLLRGTRRRRAGGRQDGYCDVLQRPGC